MRAQLSLEFLVYMSVSGIALAASVSAVASYYGSASGAASQYAYFGFVGMISRAVYLNATIFTGYVPPEACRAGSANVISPYLSGYYMPMPVNLDKKGICPSGIKTLRLERGPDGWVLS
ncbi:MAG: hypothetical protein M1321_03060 [Candidatus Marsarchaeota archaeon]|nr:hypothetical protein [Candidatus Marsarchaeota archaeon]